MERTRPTRSTGWHRAGYGAAVLVLLMLAGRCLAQDAKDPARDIGKDTASDSDRVDLQLVLAVDASGSVNQARFELQRAGYAAAFRDVDVQRAIAAGGTHAIAVTMLQWTGPRLQVVVVPWMRVADAAGAEAVARAIETAPRQLFGGGTSISGAIDFSAAHFASAPWPASRHVIDVSGDGANNRGRPAGEARDAAVARDIVINGLPILAVEPDLADHYRTEVIGGPGAFLIVAETFETFAAAVRRKLVLEISARPAASRLARR